MKSLLDQGIPLAAASDAPITPPKPWKGIYGAITRRSRKGMEILAEEKIPLLQALALYTREAARSSFDEKEKGTITPGKKADLVVLSAHPFEVDEEGLKELKTVLLFVREKWSIGIDVFSVSLG